MKTKFFWYPASAFIAAVASALVCIFGFKFVAAYTVCYSIVAGVFSFVVSRFIYHLVTKDKNVDFYCSEVFGLLAVAFAFVFVTSESMAVFKIFTGLWASATICSFGFSFRKERKPEDAFSRLKENLKFAFIGDDPENAPDITRPLCVIDGAPRSADEAESLGYGAKAAEVIAYIRKVIK